MTDLDRLLDLEYHHHIGVINDTAEYEYLKAKIEDKMEYKSLFEKFQQENIKLESQVAKLKEENEMSTIVIRDMIQKMPKDTLYFPPMEDKE